MPAFVPDARRALTLVGLTGVLGAPATVALAADRGSAPTVISPVSLTAPAASGGVIAERLRAAAHARALTSTMRSARHLARLRGRHLVPSYRRSLARRSVHGLLTLQRRLRHDIRAVKRTGGAPAVAIPAQLAAIAACESGGNPGAVGGGGTYRGKYQFSYATWAAVGGRGDPAAAPEVEQDRRAAMLYARSGAGQWPVCGR
ncbi:MAG: hypothetical protein JWO02_2278 [Solirubrobacterales bacterium]|nr:hypothetical protein [Solirubrobacterales bacterium]